MPLYDPMKNRMLNIMDTNTATGNPITHMSLHTADPTSAGNNEVTGGSYARQAVSFAAASGGSVTTTGTVSFSGIAAGTTVGWVGFWDQVSTGTILAAVDITADDTFGNSGTYNVTSVTISL